jgi:hypothetical protein
MEEEESRAVAGNRIGLPARSRDSVLGVLGLRAAALMPYLHGVTSYGVKCVVSDSLPTAPEPPVATRGSCAVVKLSLRERTCKAA